MLWYAMLSHSFLQTAACQASCEREVFQQLRWFHRPWTPELSLPGRATAEAGWPHVWTSLHSGHSSGFFWILLDSENSSWFFSVFSLFFSVSTSPKSVSVSVASRHASSKTSSVAGARRTCQLSAVAPWSAWIDLDWGLDMAMDQYLYIPFLGGWTSIYQLFWCSPGG